MSDFADVKRAIALAARKTDIDAHIVWRTMQEQFRTVVFPAVHAGMATHDEAVDLANSLIDRIPEGIASNDEIRSFLHEGLNGGMKAPPDGWHDGADVLYDRSGPPIGEPEKSAGPPPPALPDPQSAASWHGREIPARRFIGDNFLPFREVSLFNGHGGSLKTQFALQLSVGVVLATGCLDIPIKEAGPVIFYSAEEEDHEMQRRCERILDRMAKGKTLADLPDLHFVCQPHDELREYDFALARVTQQKRGKETRAYQALHELCAKVRPVLVVLENVADLFPDTDIERAIVYQFMNLARRIARQHNCAVLLLQHVSEAGRQSGEQKSGSTGWHNKARYRFSLSKPTIEIENQVKVEDDKHRTLAFHKNQYGPLPNNLDLENDHGYLKLPADASFSMSAAQRDLKDEETFMSLLDRDTTRGLYHSPHACAAGIINAFLASVEGKAIGRTRLKKAMERLKAQEPPAWTVRQHPMKSPSKANLVVVRNRRYGTYDPDDGEPIEEDEDDDNPGSPIRWLEQELQGGPKVADEIFAAAKVRGFSASQIMAAKDALSVVAFGEGTPSVWKWSLKAK
jgi:RecA-family ATPase